MWRNFLVAATIGSAQANTITFAGPTAPASSGPFSLGTSSGEFLQPEVPDGLTLSQVPLPAALPLSGTGLGALGLLGWRRKGKSRAGVA
jgi:hypothetical protein